MQKVTWKQIRTIIYVAFCLWFFYRMVFRSAGIDFTLAPLGFFIVHVQNTKDVLTIDYGYNAMIVLAACLLVQAVFRTWKEFHNPTPGKPIE